MTDPASTAELFNLAGAHERAAREAAATLAADAHAPSASVAAAIAVRVPATPASVPAPGVALAGCLQPLAVADLPSTRPRRSSASTAK